MKYPPAISLPAYTVTAVTLAFIPLASAAQVLPFHRAMLLALVPPAVVNEPAAIKSLPLTARANTQPPVFTPMPTGDHTLPFHRAIEVALFPPASLKCPPATSAPLYTVSA